MPFSVCALVVLGPVAIERICLILPSSENHLRSRKIHYSRNRLVLELRVFGDGQIKPTGSTPRRKGPMGRSSHTTKFSTARVLLWNCRVASEEGRCQRGSDHRYRAGASARGSHRAKSATGPGGEGRQMGGRKSTHSLKRRVAMTPSCRTTKTAGTLLATATAVGWVGVARAACCWIAPSAILRGTSRAREWAPEHALRRATGRAHRALRTHAST